MENTATGLMGRIQNMINSSTKPLIDLLSKTPSPVGLDGFLENPRAIASYDGSGNIRSDVTRLSDTDKATYMANLKKRILEVDGKIIALE